jgi:hypothetical protein
MQVGLLTRPLPRQRYSQWCGHHGAHGWLIFTDNLRESYSVLGALCPSDQEITVDTVQVTRVAEATGFRA